MGGRKKDNRKTINNPKTNKECHLGNVVRIRNADNGMRYPKSIIKINKSINGNIHPTQKPVELLEYLIKTYTLKNQIVLDFTGGSGSLAIACVKTNRRFICIEKDKEYYEASVKRLEDAQKQLTLF